MALIVAVVACTVPILGASGFDVSLALSALVRGSVGSLDAIGSATLVRATPLVLTGLAVAVAFQAGVFNIGAEGQLLMGAAAGTATALAGRALPSVVLLPLVLAAGAAAGGAWAWIASGCAHDSTSSR